MKPQRYGQIIRMIATCQPTSIIEIGVWNGDRAIAMATEALKHNDHCSYHGFDLFEEATPETNRDELNAKANQSQLAVRQKLAGFAAANAGFEFELTRGNTRETLALRNWPSSEGFLADFAYIDGGHSVETIASDYGAVQNCPVVVFDDYYRPDANGKGADLEVFGANKTVDADLSSIVLPSTDPLNVGGTVHLAVIGWGYELPS